jgi:hypothetical protein
MKYGSLLNENRYGAGAIFVATLSNVALAFVPMFVIATKQTTMIRANMTAYSTAVGPSSETRKCWTLRANDFIIATPESGLPILSESSSGPIKQKAWM